MTNYYLSPFRLIGTIFLIISITGCASLLDALTSDSTSSQSGARRCKASEEKGMYKKLDTIATLFEAVIDADKRARKEELQRKGQELLTKCDNLNREVTLLPCQFSSKDASVVREVLALCEGLKGRSNSRPAPSLKHEQTQTADSKNFELIRPSAVKTTFNDIIGHSDAKKNLNSIVQFIVNPERFSRVGASPPGGIILYGPPGTGKTALARALAGEVNRAGSKVSFIPTNGAGFAEKWVGVGAARVKELFALARANKASIIFIDEIDALLPSRNTREQNSERKDIVNKFLAEMDGFSPEERKHIYVIGATNLLESMDQAAIRPGRFDRKIFVDLPRSHEDRVKLLEFFLSAPKKPGRDLNYGNLASNSDGFSQAELKAWVEAAALQAALAGKSEINMADFNATRSDIRR